MLTRREFLRILAVLSGAAMVTACGRAISSPTPQPGLTPDGTRTIAVENTVTPSTVPVRASVQPDPTPVPTATIGSTPSKTPIEFVTVRGDQFFYRGALFPIRGFNYYPRLHPWRTFNVGEWEAGVTEFELKLGVGLGANTVRTFIDYQFSLDNVKPQEMRSSLFAPIGEYIANVREFLDIAGRLGLRVIITLFDSLDWAIYEPRNHWIAEAYLKELIPQFANDPRILCWDLQNEPDRALYLVGAASVIPFFQRMSALVREMDPQQLQTIGWIDRARGRYFPDLADRLDFWCFHFYDDVSKLNDLVQFYRGTTTKPVLLEEFGLPSGGPGPAGRYSEVNQADHYQKVMRILEENRMCGSVLWILTDFPVGLAGNPPSPDDSPENHFGIFRLDYSDKPAGAEIRRYWKPQLGNLD